MIEWLHVDEILYPLILDGDEPNCQILLGRAGFGEEVGRWWGRTDLTGQDCAVADD